ncbi:hypothetical protein L1987_32369 [Smallanthus sonchifolius]|uniref:Uncharacterized protein n=1 Tax=Smallanthus sonchifolius TaxID=185202 RepID=A0ACB9HN26_9ASTR|nr:hypothetical protein L1987_32369 [Smallanthus sonchifolius]
MSPSGGPTPPSKHPPDPPLEVQSVTLTSDSPKVVVIPCVNGVQSESQPCSVADGLGNSTPPTIGVQREKPQSRASPYDRGARAAVVRMGLGSNTFPPSFPRKDSSPAIPAAQDNSVTPAAGPAAPESPLAPDEVVITAGSVQDADGFTTVSRKGKNKSIKLQKKKKQVVVRTSYNGLNSNQRAPISTGGVATQVGNPTVSRSTGSGFNFARAVQGPKAKITRPPVQDPSTSTQPHGPASRAATSSQPSGPEPRAARRPPPSSGSAMEVDPPLVRSSNSIKRTNLVKATSDLYPHEPMNEDGPPPAQLHAAVNDQAAGQCGSERENLVCHLNRERIEGARLLPASILSSPSPGGVHTKGGGRTYGISESQRKAIADRLSVSNSICSEETVNWCPGEWDYFNDLCISLGLDPDYCIEDVESDTENGTAQFISGLLNSGYPKPNPHAGVHAKEGTNLSSGVALYEGVQATTKVWNGMHASAELHGGGDLPMPKPLGVEVVQDVQVHVPGTGLETEFEVKAIEENHSGPVASVEGIHGLHGVYGEVRNEVLHVLNREEGLHAHSNVVHGGLDEVPMQPIEVAKVAPEGGDGINVGLVDDGVGM